MLTIILLISTLIFQTLTHRLHHTNEHHDCIYLYSNDRNRSMSELIPYCLGSTDVPAITRCYGRELTFNNLRSNDVTVTDLYMWNAPIDTINDYQMFILGLSIVSNRVYCNCTDSNWFGTNCEYRFVGTDADSHLNDIIQSRLFSQKPTLAGIPFLQSNTTCYQGLICNSTICLDWRDICNGVWDCANGDDEDNCTEIDIHGCGQKEFRCRNGMCIDRKFLFDGFLDCVDGSDEHQQTKKYIEDYGKNFVLDYTEKTCPPQLFSCGDGMCKGSPLACGSSRGGVYLSQLFSNPHEINSSETLCWQTMICSMVAVFGTFLHSSSLNCQHVCQNYDFDCFELRKKLCPKYYYFPSKNMTQDASVYFMYDITMKNDRYKNVMLPTFVCFENDTCLVDYCKDLPFINGHKCDHYTNHWPQANLLDWNRYIELKIADRYFEFLVKFYKPYKRYSVRTCSEKLYNCRSTNTCISRFWINDGERDCPLASDENSENMCKQNSTDYFQCKQRWSSSSIQCIHRKRLMNSVVDCSSIGNDELYPFICILGDSLACKYLRNDISHVNNGYFIFQELCNGVQTFVDYKNNNETDENDCQEWQNSCSNRAQPCFVQKAWESCISNRWKCRLTLYLAYKPFTFDDFSQIPPLTRMSRGKLDNLLFPSRSSHYTTLTTTKTLLNKTTTSRSFNTRTIAYLENSKNNDVSDYVLYYCHQGVLLTTIDGTDRCLCSPSYYGHSCQYQSRRVLMIISVGGTGFDQQAPSVLRLVISLISEATDEVFSIEQITHIFPTHTSIWRHLVYLRYPNSLNSDTFYVRIDVFHVSLNNVSFLSSWRYEIPFQHILPVNRIRAHLQITSIENTTDCASCSNGKCVIYSNMIEKFYCLCHVGWYGKHCELQLTEPISSCALRAQVLFTNVCICPLFTFGKNCYIQLNSIQVPCLNGGTLISDSSPSLCLCPEGFHGSLCQFKDANIIVKLSENEHIKKTIPIVAIHLLDLDSGISVTKVKIRSIFTHVQPLSTLSPIFLHGERDLPPFIFMQFYFDINNPGGDFYLIGLLKHPVNTLHIDSFHIDRCPHVNTLFNSTLIEKHSPLRRYKSYFKICLIKNMKCFVDENYLCLCDNSARFECLWFNHQASNCTAKGYCQNDGHCVEPTADKVSMKYACLCPSCIFGDVCQFTTAQYSISLDALVGVNEAVDKSIMSYIIFGIVVLFFIMGLICNLFSFLVLCRPSCQESGCGFYILCLTIVGQLGLTIFVIKFIFLLIPSLSYNVSLWSCKILESAISFIPPLFDWITACIAIERAFVVMQATQFNQARSKIVAIYIALPATILITFGSTFHKVFYRHVINDFRSSEPIWWCVMDIKQYNIKIYDTVVNIIHLVIPLSINLITTFYFVLAQTKRKRHLLIQQKHIAQARYGAVFREQFKIHLPFIISPAILGLLQTPRLILSFAFVCIHASWQVHFYIISYMISCLPLMAGTLILFLIPSPTYRKHTKKFLDKFRCICKRNQQTTS